MSKPTQEPEATVNSFWHSWSPEEVEIKDLLLLTIFQKT